ncbi:signal peptidase I [Bacillus litorisediminis]|uniref:signal peptidase I n=1 Tax=Bacillus litorisediminis TaxID=2922713 RepID=UPI001FADC67C|nr:signal peptidase I [Bacillus litorisediminis]
MFAKKIVSELYSWSKAIIFAIVLALIISIFIIQPFTVSGISMEPTLDGGNPMDQEQKGDRLLVFKTPYLLGKMPEYGDIVIIDSRVNRSRTIKDDILESPLITLFTNSPEEEVAWVKRVIGKPGDEIKIEDGQLYRNGEALAEGYISEKMESDMEPTIVPNDKIFVMGDNRNHSTDSRVIGSVPVENVLGKVVLRFYPFDKIEIF